MVTHHQHHYSWRLRCSAVYRGCSEILHADPCPMWPGHGLGQMSLRSRLSEKNFTFYKKVIPPLQRDQRRQWCFSLDCNWLWRHIDFVAMVTHYHHHRVSVYWGRKPRWGPKGRKWRLQADTVAKIKRIGRYAPCPLVTGWTVVQAMC